MYDPDHCCFLRKYGLSHSLFEPLAKRKMSLKLIRVIELTSLRPPKIAVNMLIGVVFFASGYEASYAFQDRSWRLPPLARALEQIV